MTPPMSDRPCRGPSRREALRVGALSAFGLGLADLLRGRSLASDPSTGLKIAPRAKSCILIWQEGGPSTSTPSTPSPRRPPTSGASSSRSPRASRA